MANATSVSRSGWARSRLTSRLYPRRSVPRSSRCQGPYAIDEPQLLQPRRPTLRVGGDTRIEEGTMDLYGIVRRSGWASPEELQEAAARSSEVGDTDGSGVRWIRSYVLAEPDGGLGTFCVYEADSPEAIQTH